MKLCDGRGDTLAALARVMDADPGGARIIIGKRKGGGAWATEVSTGAYVDDCIDISEALTELDSRVARESMRR
jgi:hypothetical protein